MIDSVGRALREVVAQYGRDVARDPRRLRAILADTVPDQYRREATILVTAVEESIPADLIDRSSSVPPDSLRWQLEHRLVDDRAMTPDAARWAVEAWAFALDVDLGRAAALPTPPPTVPRGPLDGMSTIPAGGPARASMPIAWLVGGVLVLVIAALVVVFLLRGSGPGPTPTHTAGATPTPSLATPSPTVSPSPTPPLSPTPTPPPQTYEQLLSWISLTGTDRDTCRQVPADPAWKTDATIVGECGPFTVPNSTDKYNRRFALYPSLDAVAAAYSYWRDVGKATPDQGLCPSNLPSDEGWHYSKPDTPEMGRQLCFVQTKGAFLFFTANHAFVMGVITAPTGGTVTIGELLDAFHEHVGINRPAATPSP